MSRLHPLAIGFPRQSLTAPVIALGRTRSSGRCSVSDRSPPFWPRDERPILARQAASGRHLRIRLVRGRRKDLLRGWACTRHSSPNTGLEPVVSPWRDQFPSETAMLPSTISVWPVTKPAASLAINRTAAATSSASPGRRNGVKQRRRRKYSGSSRIGRAKRVRIRPGATLLQRTPSGPPFDREIARQLKQAPRAWFRRP